MALMQSLKRYRLFRRVVAALMLGCAVTASSPSALPAERSGSSELPFDLGSVPLSVERRPEIESAAREGALDRLQSLLLKEYAENQQSAPLLRSLGAVLFRNSQYGYAVIAYEKSAKITPLDDRSRFSLAMAYVILNKGDSAYTQMEALANKNKQTPLYRYWLARLDFDANRFEEAIDALKWVLRLDPSFVKAHDRLGLCFEALGDYKKAEESFNRALKLNRQSKDLSPWPALNYGSMLRKLNRHDEAEPFLREAVGLDPKLGEAHYQLAVVLEQRSDLEGAVVELKHATRLDSANAKAFYALGRVYRRLGQKEESLKALDTFRNLKEKERGSRNGSPVPDIDSFYQAPN
jgi:tetratricopeptide (TPR) repeat protein